MRLLRGLEPIVESSIIVCGCVTTVDKVVVCAVEIDEATDDEDSDDGVEVGDSDDDSSDDDIDDGDALSDDTVDAVELDDERLWITVDVGKGLVWFSPYALCWCFIFEYWLCFIWFVVFWLFRPPCPCFFVFVFT